MVGSILTGQSISDKTEGIGLNGIVYHPNGYFLVDNSYTGRIYKVDAKNSENVTQVMIDQYF